jgi:hypothetical protein
VSEVVTLELKVSVRCHACSVLTPMVGIRSIVSCRGCAERIDFVAKVKDSRDGGVRYPFGGYYDALAEAALVLKDGEDCHDARDSQGSPTALRRVAAPVCLSCERPLPIPTKGTATLRCTGCNDAVGVRWPDDETRSWDPRITCIVGDGLHSQPDTREARTQGTVISCGQCGAPLSGDQTDRRRARTCTHCSAVNFLGDAAILALFPQPQWHRSYLVYEVTEAVRRTLYKRFTSKDSHYSIDDARMAELEAAQARALVEHRGEAIAEIGRGEASPEAVEHFATDRALTADEAAAIDSALDDDQRERLAKTAAAPLVLRWIASPSADLRERAATNPALGADALVKLAGDPEVAVRVAAAGRPELPKEVLATLRKDANSDVVRAVKRNPSYKPGFFEKLFD